MKLLVVVEDEEFDNWEEVELKREIENHKAEWNAKLNSIRNLTTEQESRKMKKKDEKKQKSGQRANMEKEMDNLDMVCKIEQKLKIKS